MKNVVKSLMLFCFCCYADISHGQSDFIMTNVNKLPILDTSGIKVGYEGSIDKKGKNADWDWWLYQKRGKEWVVFDVKGAGCIYNLVQHRYLSSTDPLFRFYLNGDTIPSYSLRLSELGEKYPFVSPVSDSYIGPLDGGRGPIRVGRSFVPIPYRDGCKITTDVKLGGNDRGKGEGGWGHIIYHSFVEGDSLGRFPDGEDLTMRQSLKKHGLWNDTLVETAVKNNISISPNESKMLFSKTHKGVVSFVNLLMSKLTESVLHDLWIKIVFDDHRLPDIYCPVGALGGNSLGYNDTEYLLMGVLKNGFIYNTFPMPFWRNMTLYLENKGHEIVEVDEVKLGLTCNNYEEERCGYFRNTPYYMRKRTINADSEIGKIRGTGKMVAAHITCYAERPNIISCEGDVRVYIDGNKTPKVESDGSESYVCYGWGFPTPPETHAFGGYDGLKDNPWSMTRLCINDYYPFYKSLDFNIESGEYNNQYLEHEGTVFYYGVDTPVLEEVDNVDIASSSSIKSHCYLTGGKTMMRDLTSSYEGSYDTEMITRRVAYLNSQDGSEFIVKIKPENKGVRLRRSSDQEIGQQCADVYVDGKKVFPQWYVADCNPYRRWLDDEFEIPAEYAKGKSELKIKISPSIINGKCSWNESKYTIFIYR